MFDLNLIKIDPDKSSKGTWVPWMGNAELLLARFTNRRAEAARAEVNLEVYGKLQKAETAEEVEEVEALNRSLQAVVLADHVLLGWRGISEGGVELEYSRDTAVELLKNPQLEDFYQAVVNLSLSYEHFRAETEKTVEEEVKN